MNVASFQRRNAVESLRDVVQDLLVPELKSVKVSIDSLRTEMQLRNEKLEQAMLQLSNELKLRHESLRREMQLRDDRLTERLATAIRPPGKGSSAWKHVRTDCLTLTR